MSKRRRPSVMAEVLSGSTSQALPPWTANSSTPPDAATSEGSPEDMASNSELPNVSLADGKANTSADA